MGLGLRNDNTHLPLINTRRKPYLLIGETAAEAENLIFVIGILTLPEPYFSIGAAYLLTEGDRYLVGIQVCLSSARSAMDIMI